MRRYGLIAALTVVSFGISAHVASADPVNAKNSTIVTLVCGSEQLRVVVNGQGALTPGHVLDSSAVVIPTSLNLTFTFTPTGGQPITETETAAKKREGANAVACTVPANLNTFTFPEGTLSFSGTVTIFRPGSK